jgi:hypothetical protein
MNKKIIQNTKLNNINVEEVWFSTDPDIQQKLLSKLLSQIDKLVEAVNHTISKHQ